MNSLLLPTSNKRFLQDTHKSSDLICEVTPRISRNKRDYLKASCVTSDKGRDLHFSWSEAFNSETTYQNTDIDDMSKRFTNAWTDDTEILGNYETLDMELDADQMMFESCDDPTPPPSVYEDMTFDPDPELIAKDTPTARLRNREMKSKRPLSLELSGSPPPLYRSLMNRLSLSGDRKSRSLPRSSSPARLASPSRLPPEDFVPEREQNLRNPLYTPSPTGTPCGSPALPSYLAERLQNYNSTEDIYDTPSSFPDRPPVLPPKTRKSLSLKLRKSMKLERSDSESSLTNRGTRLESLQSPSTGPPTPVSPFRHPSQTVKSPVRHDSSTSIGSRSSSLASVTRSSSLKYPARNKELEVIDTPEEEFVGTLIEKSSKSNKLEKRLSKKGKKKVQEVEDVARRKKEEEEEAADQRSSSLAMKDDWDQIDTMMMALQCDIDLTQQTIRRPSAYNSTRNKSLEEWLVKLELPEIQTMLELNGWDHIEFIRDVISKEDLTAMGINNDKVKRKFLKSVEEDLELFQHGSVPETVEEWLKSIYLSKYLNKFISSRMGSVSRVLEIWEVELTSILNIEPIGHRKRIMKSIRDLRTLQSSYDEAEKRKKENKSKSTEKETKWLHTKDDMIRGVDYPVRYFGSAKLTGPESTKQSGIICEQQQSKIKSSQKVPEFRLRISSCGVELIDKQTQKSTCSYHIEDISFVSRDKGNLLVFSFISSDRKLGIKMCHVFKAHTRNQAYEACSTIAQSFEVAYQLKKEGKNNGVHSEEKP